MPFKKGMKATTGFSGRRHSEYSKSLIGEGNAIAWKKRRAIIEGFEIDMCFGCMEAMYGEEKRGGIAGITITDAVCPICHQKKGIVAASDIYYFYAQKVTPEDWD